MVISHKGLILITHFSVIILIDDVALRQMYSAGGCLTCTKSYFNLSRKNNQNRLAVS